MKSLKHYREYLADHYNFMADFVVEQIDIAEKTKDSRKLALAKQDIFFSLASSFHTDRHLEDRKTMLQKSVKKARQLIKKRREAIK